MEDELKSRMLKYLDALEEATRSGADLASGEMADVAGQFVAYQLWSATGWATFLIAAICGMSLLAYRTGRLAEAGEIDSEPACCVLLLLALPCIVSVIALSLCLETILKALVAPKVMVLEELARLIGQAT